MADPDMLFDLTMKDADIHAALDDFFHQAGRAFAIDEEIEDQVITVHAADLGFQDTLALLLPTGYTAEEIEGIYHIRRRPQAA